MARPCHGIVKGKKNVHIEPGNAVSRCVVVTAVAGAEASQKQK